jgi:hypothetical protein
MDFLLGEKPIIDDQGDDIACEASLLKKMDF